MSSVGWVVSYANRVQFCKRRDGILLLLRFNGFCANICPMRITVLQSKRLVAFDIHHLSAAKVTEACRFSLLAIHGK